MQTRREFFNAAAVLSAVPLLSCSDSFALDQTDPAVKRSDAMDPKYYEVWNSDVQAQIDERIEKYRKGLGSVRLAEVQPNSEIRVRQTASAFKFGSHIFNFDQLGSEERNAKYKASFGELFDAATVGFYWQRFELQKGKPRFAQSEQDTQQFWNTVENPKAQPHWRRPASDPVVEFCESKGISMHAHPILWGSRRWQIPDWLPTQPEDKPEMEKAFEKRLVEMARQYQDRISSWDVVNEHGCTYGTMPDDYVFKAYQWADREFPKSVKLAINECFHRGPVGGKNFWDQYGPYGFQPKDGDVNLVRPFWEHYTDTALQLQNRGARFDITGVQMHLFNPKETLNAALGKSNMTPAFFQTALNYIDRTNRPVHLSEITITAPDDNERGRAIQAQVAANFYRLWFSWPSIFRITWWNTVDDCGAPGEPTTSGIFTRDLAPKPVYHALFDLIHRQWRTNLTRKADRETVEFDFRGFKGDYDILWTDKSGQERKTELKIA